MQRYFFMIAVSMACSSMVNGSLAQDEDPFGPEPQPDISVTPMHDYDTNASLMIVSDQTFHYRSLRAAASGRWIAQESGETSSIVLIDENGRLGTPIRLQFKSSGLEGDIQGPKRFVKASIPAPSYTVDRLASADGYQLLRDDVEVLLAITVFCTGGELNLHVQGVLGTACFEDFTRNPLETLKALQSCRTTIQAMLGKKFNQEETGALGRFMVYKIKNGTFFPPATPEMAAALKHFIVQHEQQEASRRMKAGPYSGQQHNQPSQQQQDPFRIYQPIQTGLTPGTNFQGWNRLSLDTLRILVDGYGQHSPQQTLELLRKLNRRERLLLSNNGKQFTDAVHLYASEADPSIRWVASGIEMNRQSAIQLRNGILQAKRPFLGMNSFSSYQQEVEKHRSHLLVVIRGYSKEISQDQVMAHLGDVARSNATIHKIDMETIRDMGGDRYLGQGVYEEPSGRKYRSSSSGFKDYNVNW